jgi:cytochrome P450
LQNSQVVKPDAFAPFGSGPRNCPGQALAVTEMRTLLKLVACDGLRVDFEDPDSKWELRGLTPSPKNSKCTVRWEAPAAPTRKEAVAV